MRTCLGCILIAVLLLPAAVACAAPAESASAPQPQAAAAAAGPLAVLGDAVQMDGSQLNVNLYLSIPEVFQLLTKLRVIPAEVAQQALDMGSAETTEGTASASYIKLEVHVRLAEVAPLLAAMAQTRVTARPPHAATQKAGEEPAAAPVPAK